MKLFKSKKKKHKTRMKRIMGIAIEKENEKNMYKGFIDWKYFDNNLYVLAINLHIIENIFEMLTEDLKKMLKEDGLYEVYLKAKKDDKKSK